jgi:segregation and condensation protein B
LRQDVRELAGAAMRTPELACLEGVLLLAREPLGSRKLAQLASLADGTKARTLVRQLNRRYDDEDCAFRVMEIGGGFQLMTRPKFSPWLRRLHIADVEVRLSGPALETLAVVAYRQPVLRADIEAIRGVQCGEILRQLMERELVRIVGRSEDLGRPFLYGTTRRFLQIFGLHHLEELPRPEELRSPPPSSTASDNGGFHQDTPNCEVSDQPIYLNTTGGEANVKTAATIEFVDQRASEQKPTTTIEDHCDAFLNCVPKDEDEDLDEEDDDEDEDVEEDDEFEDDEWEEVDDDDDDEDLEEEDEEEDDDWDDEEEWDDEEDDDWEDEEEEEEEEEGDKDQG